MPEKFSFIEKSILQLKQGGMVMLVDDYDRENEGDLVIAGEFATAEAMNFMIRNTGGVLCVSVEDDLLKRFNIPMPPLSNTGKLTANFSCSIDAVNNVTTGISAHDRAVTVATLLDPNATPDDIVTPGHLFPLRAKTKGVLERRGHTEGSVDLMKIAGLKPVAVISEIMNEDGTMTRGKLLTQFAEKHQLPILSIQDIVHYRLAHENWVELYSQCTVPTKKYGDIQLSIFKDKLTQQEISVINAPNFYPEQDLLVRVHSSCFTGDLLSSTRCDCGEQFDVSMEAILEKNGVLIYLSQEGRDIGLGNKIKAYALQAQGLDTVEANHALGFKADERDYAAAAHILKSFGIGSIKLLTNNPFKVQGLESYGIKVTERVPIEIKFNINNHRYLLVKKQKLNHSLSM
jgi:3,4-dihydroxy 2-butanone 4-phosphate synthase/GTP cyclohydrolase II